MGYDGNGWRLLATRAAVCWPAFGGSFLSLFYPGAGNGGGFERPGLMAVAL